VGHSEFGRHASCDDVLAAVKHRPRRRISSSDRLRLDVAVDQSPSGMQNEMYSWADQDRFGDGNLFGLVRDGAVSTGSFSAMLASIFGGNAARFSYNGESAVTGRLLPEFGFHVPEEQSKYLYVLRNGETPETAGLLKLVIRASQLPAESGACELTQALDYSRVHLNGAEFLLPREGHVSVIHADGSQAENHIQYSRCREFRGEANIRFGPSEAQGPVGQEPLVPRGGPKPELFLPEGLPFKVSFTDDIDSSTAAGGDVVRGALKTAIRDTSSKVLVPEGTPVTVRILKIRHFYGLSPSVVDERSRTREGQPSLVIVVRLETLEIQGATFPLKASPDSGFRRSAKASPLATRVSLGTLDGAEDSAVHSDERTFEFREKGPKFVVKAGFESTWVTTAQ
jgi:hypothetical protein